MDIDQTIHAPPPLIFAWGLLSFSCVLARISQRFIMFHPDGKPARARLQVTFHEYFNPEMAAQETKTNTADYSQVYIVSQSESLSSIAARVYQNPALWRAIALRNELDDPRTLAVGQRLLIPRLPYRDPENGEELR